MSSLVRSLFQFANAIPGRRRQRASKRANSVIGLISEEFPREERGSARRFWFAPPRTRVQSFIPMRKISPCNFFTHFRIGCVLLFDTAILEQPILDFSSARIQSTKRRRLEILGRAFPPAPMHNNKTRPERRKFPAAFPAMHCGRDSFSSLFYSLSCHQ